MHGEVDEQDEYQNINQYTSSDSDDKSFEDNEEQTEMIDPDTY